MHISGSPELLTHGRNFRWNDRIHCQTSCQRPDWIFRWLSPDLPVGTRGCRKIQPDLSVGWQNTVRLAISFLTGSFGGSHRIFRWTPEAARRSSRISWCDDRLAVSGVTGSSGGDHRIFRWAPEAVGRSNRIFRWDAGRHREGQPV